MTKVEVLLSTYNGSKFIKEQLLSIENNASKDVEIEIFIRDDGSTDGTPEMIKQISTNMSVKVILVEENNIGVQKSFLRLIEIAPPADIYFFCDQDDVWFRTKIVDTVNCLKIHENFPSVCISGYYVVKKNLEIIGERKFDENTDFSVLQILFANRVPGCVMAFNGLLIKELRKEIPKNVPMHDLYVLAVAQIVGKIVNITHPLIKYRQHENNVEGIQSSRINISKQLKKQQKIFSTKKANTADLASHLLSVYNEKISPNDKNKLELVIDYPNSLIKKFKLMSYSEIYYHNIRSNFLTREKILLNRH